MNQERLEKLLDAYFDEALTDSERAELEYLLLSSPAARDLFWQRARFHALLRRYGMEYWGSRLAEQFAAEAKTTRERAARGTDWRERLRILWGWFGPGFRWAAAVGMALGVLLTVWLWPRSVERPLPETAPVAEVEPAEFEPRVAQLVRAVGVEWADPAAALLPGTVLKAGTLNLKRGWVEVEFYRGARVVIEGPAEFELISDLEARCRSGKIRVEVPPPAHGFKVLSPQLNVVDVGTSFGMEVRQGGEAEVHVFEGRVEMANPTAPHDARALERGQTVRVSATGQVQPVGSAAATYVSLEDVERWFRAELRQRYRTWLESRQGVILDPTLLLYYDFEGLSANARLLPNRAPQAPVESHGTIIGCQRAQGRWPEKGALDFKQFGDRIRFALPGRFESLTCLAWVRVDGLSHRLNALMMAGKARAGEPQWQLEQDGRLLFGKRILDGWGEDHMENYKTDPLLTPEHMGLWMQVAVVYDGPAREARHYLNGREVSSHPLVQPLALVLEAMEIGNWTPQVGQPMEPIRSFNGRMDEFAMFSRALSGDEIQQAYALGRQL